MVCFIPGLAFSSGLIFLEDIVVYGVRWGSNDAFLCGQPVVQVLSVEKYTCLLGCCDPLVGNKWAEQILIIHFWDLPRPTYFNVLLYLS